MKNALIVVVKTLFKRMNARSVNNMAKYKYGKKFKASKGKHKGKLVQYRYTGGRKNTKTMVRAKR